MRVLGIVVEYNPFHNGHLYHLTEAKRLCEPDLVVAVMSGHFTQRGEVAMLDKWARAEMALALGVDLVLELPVAWALRSAGDFAKGAIEHLQSVGATHVCFGSESNDLPSLKRLANASQEETEVYREHLRAGLSKGEAYPRARASALRQSTGLCTETPNDILAIAYLGAMRKLNSAMIPVSIKRIGAGYHDPYISSPMASATAIRAGVRAGNDILQLPMPAETRSLLQREVELGRGPVYLDNFTDLLAYRLRLMSISQLEALADMEIGLPYRILDLASSFASIHDLMRALKTKRYTWTRLQRILCYALLDIAASRLDNIKQQGPSYLRVLGLRKEKTALLKRLNRTLPLVYNPSEMPKNASMALDVLATDIYVLGFPAVHERRSGQDFTHPIVTLS